MCFRDLSDEIFALKVCTIAVCMMIGLYMPCLIVNLGNSGNRSTPDIASESGTGVPFVSILAHLTILYR